MARNNLTWINGDITSYIYYDNFHLDSMDVQCLPLYLVIQGVVAELTLVMGIFISLNEVMF